MSASPLPLQKLRGLLFGHKLVHSLEHGFPFGQAHSQRFHGEFQAEPKGLLGLERKTNRHMSAPQSCDRIAVAALVKPCGDYAAAFMVCRSRSLGSSVFPTSDVLWMSVCF
jgi:hypothetical protein